MTDTSTLRFAASRGLQEGMTDYYQILGVSRNASQEEIEKAYKELARKYHPDLHPDDKNAKKKFQEVQAAFDVLHDPQKRRQYDEMGPAFQQFAGAGARRGARGRHAGGMPFDIEDILTQFFRRGTASGFPPEMEEFSVPFGSGRRARNAGRARAGDVEFELRVPLKTAVMGGTVDFALPRPDGSVETVTVKIPAGIEEGKRIRLRGKGGDALGAPGDVLLKVVLEPHPHVTRRGDHLYVQIPLTLREAIEGTKVDVPTPKGVVTLRVPPGTSSGKKLRIRGHGVQAEGRAPGDLFAEVLIVLPPQLDDEVLRLARELDRRYPSTPREPWQW